MAKNIASKMSGTAVEARERGGKGSKGFVYAVKDKTARCGVLFVQACWTEEEEETGEKIGIIMIDIEKTGENSGTKIWNRRKKWYQIHKNGTISDKMVFWAKIMASILEV